MSKAHGPERLRVYQLGLSLCRQVDAVVKACRPHRSTADQLLRCAESIPFNIAEGSAFLSPGRKAYHYNIARASAFELVAVLSRISQTAHERHSELLARPRRLANLLAKMLLGLIRAVEGRAQSPPAQVDPPSTMEPGAGEAEPPPPKPRGAARSPPHK